MAAEIRLQDMTAAQLTERLQGEIEVSTTWLFGTIVKLDGEELQDINTIANRATELTAGAWSGNRMDEVADLNGRVAEITTAVTAKRNEMWTITRWVMSAVHFVFGDSVQGLFDANAEAAQFNSFVEMLSGDNRGAFLGKIYNIENEAASQDAEANAERLAAMAADPHWAANNVHTVDVQTLVAAKSAVEADLAVEAEAAAAADVEAADAEDGASVASNASDEGKGAEAADAAAADSSSEEGAA